MPRSSAAGRKNDTIIDKDNKAAAHPPASASPRSRGPGVSRRRTTKGTQTSTPLNLTAAARPIHIPARASSRRRAPTVSVAMSTIVTNACSTTSGRAVWAV